MVGLSVTVSVSWWQGPDQCRDEAGLSNEHEDDQVDVSSPDQVNDRMTERLDSERRHVQEPPE